MDQGPLTVLIFGASGDLTSRKLIPSLYRLHAKKRLPDELQIVGVARSEFSDESFREKMSVAVREFARREWDEQLWQSFAQRLHYVRGDGSHADGLQGVQRWLDTHEKGQDGRRLYYLSVAPSLYEPISEALGQLGMNEQKGAWRRLVIEKPFGHDLSSCVALNQALRTRFNENQIYRIDHYLGKETVQNILVFRFANTLWEPIWNHNYIDHVQITVSEKVTMEGRGAYYDQAGVLRDMFQNHLLQVLALITMEAPARYAADTLRNEKVKVLDAIHVRTVEEVRANLVCGQFAGYLSEKGVNPNSKTPTFAALKLEVDNWRWRGVPIYLRSGKGLNQRASEVVIQFRCPPHLMFPLPRGETLECNRLSLSIQPNEGIHIQFQTKVPDTDGMKLSPANLAFEYDEAYPDKPIPEAYERLLLDAMNGDAALFMRSDEIERAWEIIDPFIVASQSDDAPKPHEYAVGSCGPKEADSFLSRDGRSWTTLCSVR